MLAALKQFEFSTIIDLTDIITTAMIVGGSAAVTLWIYFHSIRPTFSMKKSINGDSRKLCIGDINRSIRKCSVSIHGVKLLWDGVNRTSMYLPPGGGGNLTIPKEMVVAGHSKVTIRFGSWWLPETMRYEDIPPV
jgi:hypothetical protein